MVARNYGIILLKDDEKISIWGVLLIGNFYACGRASLRKERIQLLHQTAKEEGL